MTEKIRVLVILTTCDTDDCAFEGVPADAHGYLLKESGSEVVASTHTERRGDLRVDVVIAHELRDALRRSLPQTTRPQATDEPAYEPLSERESGILKLIAQGLNNRQIAARLSLAEGTVRNYNSRILSKLHAYDRTQAVIKAARQGIVKL